MIKYLLSVQLPLLIGAMLSEFTDGFSDTNFWLWAVAILISGVIHDEAIKS